MLKFAASVVAHKLKKHRFCVGALYLEGTQWLLCTWIDVCGSLLLVWLSAPQIEAFNECKWRKRNKVVHLYTNVLNVHGMLLI